MVARRGCNHSLRSLFGGEAEQLVQSAPFFVSASSLTILQLQVNGIAGHFGKCFRARAGRDVDRLSNAAESRLYLREIDHCGADCGGSRHFNLKNRESSPYNIGGRDLLQSLNHRAKKLIRRIKIDDCTLATFPFRPVIWRRVALHSRTIMTHVAWASSRSWADQRRMP